MLLGPVLIVQGRRSHNGLNGFGRTDPWMGVVLHQVGVVSIPARPDTIGLCPAHASFQQLRVLWLPDR